MYIRRGNTSKLKHILNVNILCCIIHITQMLKQSKFPSAKEWKIKMWCIYYLRLEKEMATDSNILAWKIPWTEEPSGLQSMGSQRVGHKSPDTTRHLIFSPTRVSLVAQMVKNLPAMQEVQVLSLGWEDLLEKGVPTHSTILVWRISWTEEPGRLQSMGSRRVRHDWATNKNGASPKWTYSSHHHFLHVWA